MNPRDYLRLAERLVAGGTSAGVATPAECRAAISRAYYAAFNVGAETLRGLGLLLARGAAAHGELRQCLANSGDAQVAAAASTLGSLHTERNRADYQLDRTDVERPSKAQLVVRQAGDVIRALDQIFSGPARLQIKATIEAWRRANGYR